MRATSPEDGETTTSSESRSSVTRRKRIVRWLTVGAVVCLLAAAGVVWMLRRPIPNLILGQQVPPEVRQATDMTWSRFLAAFPERERCIGAVGLTLVDRIEGGDASYNATDRVIRIQIPTSPTRYPQLLAHELGHHLENACDADTLAEEVGRVQGLAPTQPETAWFDRPSEHFADAVVEIVVGRRTIHEGEIELNDEALEMVKAWGEGR